MHRGPFSQGSFHPDDGFWFSEKRIYPGGPTWRNLWEKYKIDAVMAGHNHNFTLAEKNGIKYITLCSGAPAQSLNPKLMPTTLYAEPTCGVGLFEITPVQLRFSFQRLDSSIIEAANFSLNK